MMLERKYMPALLFSPCDINGEKFHGAAICSKFILNHVILYRIHVQNFVSREV